MAGYQPPRARLAIAAHQTLDLPNAPTRLQRRLALTESLGDHGLHHPYPIQLSLAQRNRLLCHVSPQWKRGHYRIALTTEIYELTYITLSIIKSTCF